MAYYDEYVGKSFGRLTVNAIVSKNKRSYFECSCSCGNIVCTRADNVCNGVSKSCGCLKAELCRDRKPGRFCRKGELTFQKSLYSRYKMDSIKRHINFTLSFSRFLDIICKPCVYCGSTNGNVWKNQSTGEEFSYSGIDRIDSSKGYDDTNVDPCCSKCNYAKRSMSRDEFLFWIRRIYDYNGMGRSFVDLPIINKKERIK